MTRAKLTSLLAGLLCVFVGAGSVLAAETKSETYVVLVGISQYADPQIKPRPRAETDAKALYDVLTDKKLGGVDAAHIRLLLGQPDPQRHSQPATRDNILKALRWVVKEARREDHVIFAFLGQGGPFADRACYFASDSAFKGLKNTVAAGDIEHELEKLKSHQFCAFLDVNFRGYDSKGEPVADTIRDNRLYQEYLGTEENTTVTGRVLFLATDGFTQSLDLPNQGLFTKVIVDGLKGAADKDGYEPDGVVTVDELAEYISKQLPELARTHGKTRDEQHQLHFVHRTRASNFVLTRNPGAAPTVEERLAKLAALAKKGELPKELVEEGQKLLSRMPKLNAQRALRRNYQSLVDGRLTVEEFTTKRNEILAETKLKRSAALSYASKVIQATQQVRDNYVREVSQGELVENALRGLYRRIEEPIPPEIRERLDNARNLNEEELTTLLTDVRERLGKREDLANNKDLDISLQRMLGKLDPYTTYIDSDMLARFKQDTDGRFTGIGIQINTPARDIMQVVTPLKGSPAYRAGLKAGDIITKITREVDSEGRPLDQPEEIPTKGLRLDEAVKRILGKPGTKLKLTVEREGVGSLEFEITRAVIEVETILGVRRKDDDEWDYWIDPASKICYIRVTSFARNTSRDLGRVISRLEKTGIKGLILDLRFNPGGLLTSAVEVSDLFIDDGRIVTIRPRVGRETPYFGEHYGSKLNFPMVCLVNGLSASGSEIVAACLQDHKRALVIGERSYGKGSVQNIQSFEGGELKMTTASFWRPNEKNLNRSSTSGKESDDWGVTPDKGYLVKLENRERDQLAKYLHDTEIIPRRDIPPKEAKNDFKDRQVEAALDYLRGQLKTASKSPTKKAG
jgi:C-terminal peptidase prc